jgi:uncharacterized membrane protein (UPF0127 family)
MKRFAALLAVFLVFVTSAWSAAAQEPAAISTLVINSASGVHRFQVELADTPERRSLGLMHRRSMPANAGMLFDFKSDEPVAMWMRNTIIPLDMLFIARDGRVVNIAERTVPFSETGIPSKGPVRAVLELNAGTASRLGIKPGDRVTHPIFANAK